MSGPKTSRYSIRAARQREQARRQAEERTRREELASRVVVAQAKCSTLERRSARLASAVRELQISFPAERVKVAAPDFRVPQTEDPLLLEKYAAKIEDELARAESALRKAGDQAKANQDFRGAIQNAANFCAGDALSAEEVMRRFSETTTLNLNEKLIKVRRSELDRILGRYASVGWESSSPRLEQLVMEALSTRSEPRYGALTTEIRHQIQLIKHSESVIKADAQKAKALLSRLEREDPFGSDHLKQRLELVRVGAIPFPEGMEALVGEAIAVAEQARGRETQEAASGIVRDALKDLGYEVSPIEETLFVRGGKIYFRKPGWDDYCVRLMVRPDESKINFNVVRIAGPADKAHVSSGTADIEAENAWCSGYQQLVDTFKARGLETELTRHLAVGTVPVPVVGSDEISQAAFGAPGKQRKAVRKTKVRGGDAR